MKRDWNQSADRLASAALQQEKGTIITSDQDLRDLISLNRLNELLTPKRVERVVNMAAITRSTVRKRSDSEVLQERIVQKIRMSECDRRKKRRLGSPS